MGNKNWQWTSEFILQSTQGKLVSSLTSEIKKVQTDSRLIQAGDIFVALKGEAFDGHTFVTGAAEKGASVIIIHEWNPSWENFKSKTCFIQVTDTLQALQDLAHAYRKEMGTWLAGITGSNGKTSTKEFAAALIKPYQDVHWSQGSFNNHWGVPFTLLDLKPEHKSGLIEMGMNHVGEITRLMEITEPNCVVCTMVGRAHIEHFGSLDAIAKAKAEIYEAAKPGTFGIFNLDDESTIKMFQKYESKFKNQLTFSQKIKTADIFLYVASQTLDELVLVGHILGVDGEKKLSLFGVQNVVNISAAVGIAVAAGLKPDQIWDSLTECKSYWGRNQKLQMSTGASVLFDAYNANPDSMQALLKNVKTVKGFKRKIGFFAEMRELGNFAVKEHEALAKEAATSGYDQIYFYGPSYEAFNKGLESAGFKGATLAKADFDKSWIEDLKGQFGSGDLLTLKGSRGMYMERVIQALDPALNFQK